jgi:colanic acid/amylovoran biosynthesis glycosyltransferase
MSSTTRRRALFYADTLHATSESFVTALLATVRSLAVDLTVVTHRVAAGEADGKGEADDGTDVTFVRRYERRFSPAWLADRTLRTLTGRELFAGRLRRLLARRPADIYHAQFGQPGYHLFKAIERSGVASARLIVNFYGYDATGLVHDVPAWAGRYREMFAYPRLTVVAEGPRMKQRLVELGCPAQRVEVIPLCLRVHDLMAEVATAPALGGKTVLGFIGRFAAKKGLLFALEHLAPLLAAEPRLALRLVGDGAERHAVEEIITRRGLQSSVSFAGMVSYRPMLDELKGMSALLVPSLTAPNGDSEGGAPTVLAEAQILGVPVIASDHADIPFALADHSYLFAEGDGTALAATVARFLSEDGRSYDIEAARRATLKRYDPEAIGERYRQLYGLTR